MRLRRHDHDMDTEQFESMTVQQRVDQVLLQAHHRPVPFASLDFLAAFNN
jgi:hypothetical protein